MASIIVTMATMVVISLIVIGFATISRREQRQSLDQLLSSQAFYAAESGIEDATGVIKANLAGGKPILDKTDCTTNLPSGISAPYPTADQMKVDAVHDVSYSCLLVDKSPTDVKFDGVNDQAIVVPIESAANITSVRITWKPSTPPSAGTPANCPGLPLTDKFTPQATWPCGYGVLRVDLVPTPAGALTSAALANNMANGFFVPVKVGSAGTLNYAGALNKANVVAASCNVAAYTQCQATIQNINVATTRAMLRISSLYESSDITIESFNGATQQQIVGVQAKVDSTGRASDILRRIQVRVPLIETDSLLPGSAISSNASVCKRFQTTGTYFSIGGDIVDADASNDMCKAKTDGTP